MNDEAESRKAIADFVATLLARGRLDVAECPLSLDAARELGFQLDRDSLILPPAWDPLDAAAIRHALAGLSQAWLRVLEVWPTIGSTNAELADRAQRESILGHVCMAELQLAGRGRRGRGWFSPLGGNLALSLGFDARRPPAELGGFSLVVGLAVLDALEAFGIGGLALKWPNDILLNGAKLGGILIELVQGAADLSLVVGVGLNLRLPDQVRGQLDQPVADLASAVSALPGRSALASRLISSIVEFEDGFARTGFGPFAPIFDRRHAYQDAEVQIVQGDRGFDGRVLGVAPDGGLRVRSSSGEQVVHGGEVSLRARPAAPV